MFKHLLLPTDGSELSEVAIQKCVRFAKSINAKVTGLTESDREFERRLGLSHAGMA